MESLKFTKEEELYSYLKENGLTVTQYPINQSYITALIGITDDGKLVYDYTKMVEFLMADFEKNEACEDPYLDAVEWIDYNFYCSPPNAPVVVHSDVPDDILKTYAPEEAFPILLEVYKDGNIYTTDDGIVVFNNLFTEEQIAELENIFNNAGEEYKMVVI